jgi:UDP-glucose 4-epimerase
MQLITGGMGFVGLHTARALLDMGETCVLTTQSGTIRQPEFLKNEIGGRIFVEQADVGDPTAVLALGKRYAFTGIVHLSGASPIGTCEHMRTNTLHLLNVLQAAQDWKVRRLSIASTIGVYAGANLGSGPLHEDQHLPMTAFHPIPSFKKVAELLAATVSPAGDFEAVCFRFGAWGPLFHHPPSPMNILSQLVRAAVRGKKMNCAEPSSRAFAEDGVDLAYIKDCGRAIALLQTAEKLNYRTYNIGSGAAIRYRTFVEALQRTISDAVIEIPEGYDPRGLGRLLELDITRLREDTGYEPQYDIERGIADYVLWLRAGNEW